MIDIKLFIINMFCIIGASFLVYILLTYFKVTGDKTYISIFIGIIIVLAFYCWINIPEFAGQVPFLPFNIFIILFTRFMNDN